jgi:sec-independent protein translocase protein TatA
MFRDIGAPEIALIVIAIILVFGVGKLAGIGGALGKSIREFRRELKEKPEDTPKLTKTTGAESKGEKTVAQLEGRPEKEKLCPKCGEKMPENAKFCMGCGAKIED